MVKVDVYWAVPHTRASVLHLLHVLDPDERLRADRYADAGAFERFVTGVALLREAVGARTGAAPAQVRIDRTCGTCGEPHGRPLIVGEAVKVSVTHTAGLVGVALSVDAPVGLDVEVVRDLSARDVGHLAGVLGVRDGDAPEVVLRQWTRLESVVKATGDGIAGDLSGLTLGAATEPPAVHAYPGHETFAAHLVDLRPTGEHLACLTVLSEQAPVLREHHQTGAGPMGQPMARR
ncbi:hypothetical protein ABEG17_08790 [Pedococcus sp. KACC 23699]|uniref:4'-phosphopantetheinyl transferase superfamily protein n=1 Tax=Pedococcus sp. KACC 23699 TaxID=3149228 RepID=A0AAU7JZ18_9MICO